jgi:hypothetical protein
MLQSLSEAKIIYRMEQLSKLAPFVRGQCGYPNSLSKESFFSTITNFSKVKSSKREKKHHLPREKLSLREEIGIDGGGGRGAFTTE